MKTSNIHNVQDGTTYQLRVKQLFGTYKLFYCESTSEDQAISESKAFIVDRFDVHFSNDDRSWIVEKVTHVDWNESISDVVDLKKQHDIGEW